MIVDSVGGQSPLIVQPFLECTPPLAVMCISILITTGYKNDFFK